MTGPRVVILGGGLSGASCAFALAEAGWSDITILERGSELGGLAGSFERAGHFYPLGYHHILHRDRLLLYFLARVGALGAVRWRKIKMLFRLGGRLYDLSHPYDFLRFPMSVPDKLRFVRLMLRAFGKADWSDWNEKSAADLVDAWGGPGVRTAIFERLTRLKFSLPCEQVSGAWLGARLHFREGSAPLGYLPNANWTRVLCDGVTRLLAERSVHVRLGVTVSRLSGDGDRMRAAELVTGERIDGDLFVSTVPTEVYRKLAPGDSSPGLGDIRYTALVSVVGATRQRIAPDFYWMNLASLEESACGIFLLSSLNPTIGGRDETCVNFVTHIASRDNPFFQQTDAELLAGYQDDFRAVFGFELELDWHHIARVPMYSPVFLRGYRNPPVRSSSWQNLYFAGNYRTFPSIASTGTALGSGLEAAQAMLTDRGQATVIGEDIARFAYRRPRSE